MLIYHFNEIYVIIYIVMDEITKFLSLTHVSWAATSFLLGEKKTHVMF
jgi:hypothetical protein